MASSVRITDGSFDFAGGVDSGKTPTIASELVPHGLKRDHLSWAVNCTVRGGGITQRTGMQPLCTIHPGNALYQGGWLYDASTLSANPWLMLCIGGHVYQVRVDQNNAVIDLSEISGYTIPATSQMAFFTQGEEFLIIQAGDGTTNPLFYNGTNLWRSMGLAGSELPPATSMTYHMGRIWYAQDRQYTAGDIVGGPSGTAPYRKRDSILKVTENPLALAGDGFIVPTQSGLIRGLRHTANLDTALGEGLLHVFTRKTVYSLNVPVTRTEWTNAKEPLQRVAADKGSYGDRCLVNINGDLFYQSTDGIRSLTLAIRYFQQWGNTPISNNVERLLRFNDRSMMRYASGIEFDNRLLQTGLPYQTEVGIAFKALAVLDFDLISSLEEKLPPAWEGSWDGADFLQLFTGDYGGRERAFAVVRSRDDGSIQVWEITTDSRRENGDKRISWLVETPAYTFGKEFELKKLDGGEIWIDKVYGTVDLEVYYRPDAYTCWQFWTLTSFCSARSSCEDIENPVCYPEQTYREGSKFQVTLPSPPIANCNSLSARQLDRGFQFQIKIVVRGWCRIRGIMIHALPIQKAPFENMSC